MPRFNKGPGFDDTSLLKGDEEPELARTVSEAVRKVACAKEKEGDKCSISVTRNQGKPVTFNGTCHSGRCEDLRLTGVDIGKK